MNGVKAALLCLFVVLIFGYIAYTDYHATGIDANVLQRGERVSVQLVGEPATVITYVSGAPKTDSEDAFLILVNNVPMTVAASKPFEVRVGKLTVTLSLVPWLEKKVRFGIPLQEWRPALTKVD